MRSDSSPQQTRPVAIEVETPDDVFLTPRVVDEVAFDRFAGDLRRLIQDAATAGRALVRTSSETDRHLTSMREASGELRSQVETGARLIPTIDQRVKRIEEVLTKAEDRVELEARISEHIDAIVREKIESATVKAAEVAKRMGAAIEKASDLTRTLTQRLDAATTAAEEAADRTEELSAQLVAEAERGEKILQLARTTIDEGELRIGTALTEAEVATGSLTKTISDVAEQIAPHVEAAKSLIEGAQRAATDPVLTEAVKSGESAKRTLLRAIREAKSIIEQTDQARRQLADDLEGATSTIDEVVETRVDTQAESPVESNPIRFRRTDT